MIIGVNKSKKRGLSPPEAGQIVYNRLTSGFTVFQKINLLSVQSQSNYISDIRQYRRTIMNEPTNSQKQAIETTEAPVLIIAGPALERPLRWWSGLST